MAASKVKPQALVYGRTTGNQNVPVQVDANGVVQVGGAGGGGTSSTFGAAFPSGGTASGFKDSGGTLMQPGNLDASGNLKVAVISGGGAGVAPSASAHSRVSGSTSSQTALSSNASRVGAAFVNEGDVKCYLKFGATASATSYDVPLLPGEKYELPRSAYTGRIDVIWDAAFTTGSLNIGEYT